MNIMVRIGDHIIFVDELSASHHALVTVVHGSGATPSVNLIYVDASGIPGNKNSVVHQQNQSAGGNYWREFIS